jgi:hypothetical protein
VKGDMVRVRRSWWLPACTWPTRGEWAPRSPTGTDHSAPAYSESGRPLAFAIAVVNIRCGGVDLCGERSGVAAAFAIGRVFAIAGFAVAREDCTQGQESGQSNGHDQHLKVLDQPFSLCCTAESRSSRRCCTHGHNTGGLEGVARAAYKARMLRKVGWLRQRPWPIS